MSATQPIVSSANPRFRRLLELSSRPAARREAGLAVIEGEHLLATWLQHAPTALAELYLRQGGERAEPLRTALERSGVPQFELAEPLFRRASMLEHSPGPIALIRVPDQVDALFLDGDAVYLDRLQDPGNAGTILRSAAAFGIGTVMASPGTVDLWSPKVLRAAMGAHPLLTIAQDVPLDRLAAGARVPLCATSSHSGLSIVDADLGAPRIWLFGSEGAGLDPAAMDASRVQWLCIEQRPAMESLNVGVAASICLHEQFRQRRKRPVARSLEA